MSMVVQKSRGIHVLMSRERRSWWSGSKPWALYNLLSSPRRGVQHCTVLTLRPASFVASVYEVTVVCDVCSSGDISGRHCD